MTEYVKSTNFASKDSLSIGNPLKIVKGTEIDTEFNNIATAVATKADIANPTFTGVPSAPTATLGTSTSQLATTAFVLQHLYPVGSVYLNATNSTNPATLFGFGTWTAFGAGRMPVGFNAADPLFDAAEETGGSKAVPLLAHSHTYSGTTSGVGNHTHGMQTTTYSGSGSSPAVFTGGTSQQTAAAGAHDHTFGGTTSVNQSGDQTNGNLPPYITVYMWKRTA